jgi:hypothetical protein
MDTVISTSIALAGEATLPRKWPFPPAPPSRSTRAGGAARGNRRMDATACLHDARNARQEAAGRAPVGLGSLIGDVVMVAAWGAAIPALMWLGSALGM